MKDPTFIQCINEQKKKQITLRRALLSILGLALKTVSFDIKSVEIP